MQQNKRKWKNYKRENVPTGSMTGGTPPLLLSYDVVGKNNA